LSTKEEAQNYTS